MDLRKGDFAMANTSSLKCQSQFIPFKIEDVEAGYLLGENGVYIEIYFS